MAPHSSTLAWKIPWTEEPGRLQSTGSLRVGTTERLHFHFSLSCFGEGNGTHFSILAWRIPGTGEPSGLLSMGSHRVRTTEATQQQQQQLFTVAVQLENCPGIAINLGSSTFVVKHTKSILIGLINLFDGGPRGAATRQRSSITREAPRHFFYCASYTQSKLVFFYFYFKKSNYSK